MQKTVKSRALAWALSVLMVVAFMPTMATSVHAADTNWSFVGSQDQKQITASYGPAGGTQYDVAADLTAKDKTYDGEAYDGAAAEDWEQGNIPDEIFNQLRPIDMKT